MWAVVKEKKRYSVWSELMALDLSNTLNDLEAALREAEAKAAYYELASDAVEGLKSFHKQGHRSAHANEVIERWDVMDHDALQQPKAGA